MNKIESVRDAVPAQLTRAVVKWFNAVKGYGFLTPVGGLGDIFVHMTVLRQAGFERLMPGTTVVCDVVQGAKGLQVLRIIEIDTSTAQASPDGDEFDIMGASQVVEMEPTGELIDAIVKWFNPHKGYGFVCPRDAEGDIFVHMVILRRAGIPGLVTGQNVIVRVAQGPKGLQATELSLV